MTEVVIQFLAQHSWIIWVWFAASILAVAIRAGYPVTEQRPKWVVIVLAVIDLLQLNFSGPVKLAAKPKE